MINDFIQQLFWDFVTILNKMSPYLLLGFLFAGILKVFLPQKFIDKHLAHNNFKSVFLSALFGIPMPLCSCGVIPTGVSLHKNGASKGATVSFLISTPQTGVDSILVTYSLLGLPFAILRTIAAFFTGVFGGVLNNAINDNKPMIHEETHTSNDCCSDKNSDSCCSGSCDCSSDPKEHSKLYTMLKYAFVDFLQDIAKWLIIGLLIAAFISALIPDNFFEQFIGNQWIEMLIILLASIPLYVCATGSVPIVVVLMLKGLSPGAALVFLMAGPATNAATITVLRKSLGRKTTWIYLFAIILGAMFFGILMNNFLPHQWFSLDTISHLHSQHFIPQWLEWGSSIMLIALIINGFYQKKYNRKKHNKTETSNMEHKRIIVKGMNCNHCKKSVEDNLIKLDGIIFVSADLSNAEVVLEGKNIDLRVIKAEVEKLGFEYGEEIDFENLNNFK